MIRKALVAGTAILPLVLGMTPAHADLDDGLPVSDIAHIGPGSGTITPGLPCSPCTIHYGFLLVRAGDEGPATTECRFDGTDSNGTMLSGSGGGTTVCDDGTTCWSTFTREGGAFASGGRCKINGLCHTFTAVMVFVPENVNPTTDFFLDGWEVLTDAPDSDCA